MKSKTEQTLSHLILPRFSSSTLSFTQSFKQVINWFWVWLTFICHTHVVGHPPTLARNTLVTFKLSVFTSFPAPEYK